MKTNVLLALVVSTFISVQACAQNAPVDEASGAGTRRERMMNSTPEQRAERQTAQMKKQLLLTGEQETTVAAINLKYAQKAQTLLTTAGRDRGTIKQARALRESKDAELKDVLSKEQYAQYGTLQEGQRDRIRQGMGERNNRQR